MEIKKNAPECQYLLDFPTFFEKNLKRWLGFFIPRVPKGETT